MIFRVAVNSGISLFETSEIVCLNVFLSLIGTNFNHSERISGPASSSEVTAT